jgi:alpha-glucosidase
MNLNKIISFISMTLLFTATSCTKEQKNEIKIESPNGKYTIVYSNENKTKSMTYSVLYNKEEIIKSSKLGFLLENSKELSSNYKVANVENNTVNQSWTPPYGERNEYPENYNESIITLEALETGTKDLQIQFRAYNEGIAFRYNYLGEESMVIEEELTEFTVNPNDVAWASLQSQTTISKVLVSELEDPNERPLLIQKSESLYLAIGEAAQIDYARMKLISKDESGTIAVSLGSKVVESGAFSTPWRFVMAGKDAGDILENNYLILNLNEPNKITDTSWLKPGKVIRDLTLTTSGGKAYIDFAVKHNLQYVIESAGWYGDEFTTEADASTVTVDPKRSTGPLGMEEVIRYGKEKGIGIMLYINRNQMEKQLDEVLPLYESWGIKGLKYGFVRTGDQEWSSWMHEAVRKAADHKMVLSIHDDYRPVGYSRTYPNLMTQEGIRGDEETPSNEHTIKTMFTRMIAGAGDNTICYFAPRVDVMGSHASQLAKSVCIYSPLLWLYWYDRPITAGDSGGAGGDKSIIEDVPELEFFDNLPTVWDKTKVIHSEVGILGTIARKSGDDWFVGTINGSTDRFVTIPLNFLERGVEYEATVYYDDESVNTVTRVGVEKIAVNNKSEIARDIFKNNGLAIHIRKKD